MYQQFPAKHAINQSTQTGLWEGVLSTGHIELKLRAGEALFCEGDDADFVYEVLEGVVCSYFLLADGRRQVTGFAYPGDIIGLGHHDTHQTNCDAVRSARVRSLPRSRLMRVVNEQPELGSRLLHRAVDELSTMRQHFLLLGRKTAQEKLASFLLVLARRFGGEEAEEVTFNLPMTRADIADYLGLTMETVSRGFSKLKSSGVIDLPQCATVHVRDIFDLEQVAEVTDEAF